MDTKTASVIGFGYIEVTIGTTLLSTEFTVTGIEVSLEIINTVKLGKSPFMNQG